MADLERLLQPTFAKHRDGRVRSAPERDDAAAVATYRYLRLGLVLIVIALGWSLGAQRVHAGCWQGSISAYYYTPVHSIFVGGMVAIGVALIAIKGSTVVEDLLLNFAGMLAPVVAFVPTNDENLCVPGKPLGKGVPGLPPAIITGARNNVQALLVAGSVALAIGVAVHVFEQRRHPGPSRTHARNHRGLLLLTALLLVVGWWFLASDRFLEVHGPSATVMFVALAVASIANGLTLFWRYDGRWLFWVRAGWTEPETKEPHWRTLAWLYSIIGAAMIVAGLTIKFAIRGDWHHRVLVLEVVEITLFACMWTVQSVERWGTVIQTRPHHHSQAVT